MMLMDDPRDWQARMDSLQTAVSETNKLMSAVIQAHLHDVSRVFGAQDQPNAQDDPLIVAQNFLGATTPKKFLESSAAKRPTAVPKALRKFKRRDFYHLVKETIQLQYCLDLLDALEKFSHEGFKFFKEGYYTKKDLSISRNVPPRMIMRTLIDQASIDLSVIQHAINQRRRRDDGLATLQGTTLTMADELSKMAIGRAVDAGYLPKNTRVITYLARAIRSRLVPYSPTLLISIPYSALHSGTHPSRNFLAIPHEVGHHLFWNGTQPESKRPMREHLLKKASEAGISAGDWRLNWLEELFADSYALVLNGPVIVLDFQDMLDDDMSAHFREDTDKHPIPAIRPFIQTKILRQLTDQNGKALYTHECDQLDKNWKTWIKEHPLKASFALIDHPQPVLGQAILDELTPLITVILDTMVDILPTKKEFTGMNITDDVSQLYTEFQGYKMPDDDLELVNRFLEGNATDEEVTAILTSNPKISFKKHIAAETRQKPEKIKTAEWMQLLRSYGWSNEGPIGDDGGTRTSMGNN
ncbi:MAG: hypothetical protein H6657_02090 [Ardenticatenaceae bacterium]|nr:hypothetical protein [Anaerolineales bacterium]MCB8976199.1 hypothetical protein [Ardenticatenaceae bacterium]